VLASKEEVCTKQLESVFQGFSTHGPPMCYARPAFIFVTLSAQRIDKAKPERGTTKIYVILVECRCEVTYVDVKEYAP
jgi:hypothetical protein